MRARKLRLCCTVATILLLAFPSLVLGQIGRDIRILALERELTLFSASIGSGARALAMGGAFIAIADDGTAASWNPAGLGVLEETELSFNWQPLFSETLTKPPTRVAALAPVTENGQLFFADTGSTRLTRTSQSLDFLSLAVPIRIAGRKLVPQFSFHSVVPALDAEFEGSPSEAIIGCGGGCRQRRVTEGSAFVTSDGGIDVYAASIGIPLRENLRVGVSLNWWRGDTRTRIDDIATQTSSGSDAPNRDAGETEIRSFSTVEETDSLNGFNANLGMILELTRWVHIGAVFKTPFGMRREGTGVNKTSLLLRSLRDPSAQAYQSLFLDARVESEGEINWPATLGFGFAWFPASAVTVSTDFTWSNWSEARYDEQLTSSSSLIPEPTTTSRNDPYPAEMQVDAWQYRLGAELVLVNPSFAKLLAIPLRGGFFLDRQYFLDFEGNTILNRGVSGGVGFVWRRLTLDFAYMYSFAPRESAARVEEIAEGITGSSSDPFEGFRQEPGEGKFSRHQVLVTAIVRF